MFDDVAKYINVRHDLRSSDLATLIVTTYRNGGKLSSKRRKRFADRVQTVLDDVEATVANRMRGLSLSGGQLRSIGTRMGLSNKFASSRAKRCNACNRSLLRHVRCGHSVGSNPGRLSCH
ncbi:hypothetical protein [Rhodoferax sp.]|uniref:hypothetical protein n=1 Tax=Rhodoferax sp. TaxID=50421 RepID=UPI00261C911D|nr:hypothetical protein [Rhodoferax sp.]